MSRIMALLVIGLLVMSSMVSVVSAQENTREFTIPNRISFTYRWQIAQDAVWQRVPAAHDEQTPTGPIPEYTEILFQNYRGSTGWENTGQYIRVYPVVTFPANPNAPYTQALTDLRAALAARDAAPASLPMLPIVTATQVMRSHVQYIDFANGTGVGYVTAARLDVSPIGDDVLFYSFQGLTNDGMYYIAALFPVQSGVLPIFTEGWSAEELAALAERYDAYLADLTAQLDAVPPQNFTPDLTAFTNLFASMQITAPAATFSAPDGAATSEAAFAGTQFTYDTTLASRIEVDVLAPIDDPDGMYMFGSQPGRTEFSLIDYPVTRPYGDAIVRVIPVESFPDTGTISDILLGHLQTFLAEQAPLTARANISSRNMVVDPIPALPPVNAAQVIVVKPEYIAFQNGSGVRFVTFYAQDAVPLTNGAIFYNFQGITADGKYVIAAEFPLSVPALPDSIDFSTFDWDAYMARYTDYIEETVTALDGAAPGDYTPTLDTLDALIASLRVE